MLIVAFDLSWAPEMAFHQQRVGVAAEGHRGGIVRRATRDGVFGLTNVRNDGFERKLDASRHAGQTERCAHDFEESAARGFVEPFGSALRKFAVQGFLERGAAGEFFERAPVLRASLVFLG